MFQTLSHVDVFQTISHVDVFQTISQSEDEGPSLQTVSDPPRLPEQEASPRTKDTQAYKVTVGHLHCNCSHLSLSVGAITCVTGLQGCVLAAEHVVPL